jgi:nucleotide-binding universal stress UspA family protein
MNTLRTIAVGYDGSSGSEAAVRWSLTLANATHSTVIVLHAIGLLEHLYTAYPRDVTPPAIVAMAKELAFDEQRLHWHVDDGDACSVLLRAGSSPLDADLLVVGSRGRGQRTGMLLGSTTLEVAEHTLTPLVIVPSRFEED